MRKSIRIIVAGILMVAFILPLENIATLKIYGDTGASYETIVIDTSSLNGNTISGKDASGNGDDAALDNSASFFADGYFGTEAGGIPRNGEYTTPNKIPYKLANGSEATAYYGKDSIRLTKDYTEHKMNLKTKGVYRNIYVLATAGGPGGTNSADFTVTLHYSDDTSADTNYALYDWYGSAHVDNVEKDPQFRRRNISDGKIDSNSSTTGGPYIQSATIECDPNRILEAISFKVTNADRYDDLACGIFAITGATVVGAPQKPVLDAVSSDGNNEVFTFSADGATSYYIDIAKDTDFNEMLSGFNNYAIPAEEITVGTDGKATYKISNSSFPKGMDLYVRVRGKNSNGQSLSSDVVLFKLPHEHAITYSMSQDKATILVGCSAEGECSIKTLGAKAILSASDATYSGNNYSGAVCTPENWDDTLMGKISSIKYSGESYTESETAPINAGDYKATVSVLDAENQPVITAEHSFVIGKKEPTPGDFTYIPPENLEADGKDKRANVKIKGDIVGMGEYSVSYYRDGKKTTSTAAPGAYDVVAELSEGDNYTSASSVKVGTFTVTPGPHSHDFSYSAKNNSLIASCEADDCYLTGSKIAMTLFVDNKVYDGEPIQEKVDGASDFKAYTEKSYKVDFYREGSTDKLAAAPINVGKYIAKMYLDDAETVVASTSFEIIAIDIESVEVTDSDTVVVKANGNTLIENTDYTLTKDTKGNITKYSVRGIGNYKGFLTREKTSVLGGGNIETTVVVEKSAANVNPSLSVPNEDSAKKLFKQAISKSESLPTETKEAVISDIDSPTGNYYTYDATVYVKLSDVTQTLSAEEKQEIQEQLKKEKGVKDAKKVADLDLSLFMKYSVVDEHGTVVDSSSGSGRQLFETAEDEIITLEVPAEYRTRDKKRIFHVVRTHTDLDSGEIERKVIKSTNEYVIKINTNKFSTYSIFYSDPKSSGGGDEPGGGGDSGSGSQSSNNGIVVEKLPPTLLVTNYGFVSPKTGDTDEIYIMLALAAVGIMIIGYEAVRNRRLRNK